MVHIDKALALTYDNAERRAELTWLAERAQRCQIIIEVGAYKGATTRALADNTTGMVFAVDTWEGSVGETTGEMADLIREVGTDGFYEIWRKNTGDLSNVSPVRKPSVQAAADALLMGVQADMIFIDASHDYDSVKADLIAWSKVIKPQGIFCGHDRQWDGVERSLRDLGISYHAPAGAIWCKR